MDRHKRLTITLPVSIITRLKQIAHNERRSVSNTIAHLLDDLMSDIESGYLYVNNKHLGKQKLIGTKEQWLRAVEDKLSQEYVLEDATRDYTEWIESKLARGLRKASETDILIYPKIE